MKGGQTPIHILRWACSDYIEDPWVKLALARGDLAAVTFYHLFLNHSFLHGGSLPADPDLLAAALGLRGSVVRKALPYWSAPDCGLILIKDGQARNPRIEREVQAELAFRSEQKRRGKEGGRVSALKRPLEQAVDPPVERPSSPPAPAPAPALLPAPAPPPTAAQQRPLAKTFLSSEERQRAVVEGNGYLDEIVKAKPDEDRGWILRQHSTVPGRSSVFLVALDRATGDEHLLRTVQALRDTAEKLRAKTSGIKDGLPTDGPWERPT